MSEKPTPEEALRRKLAEERARTALLRDGLEAAVLLVEEKRRDIAELGLVVAQVALAGATGEAWEQAAETARAILAVLQEDRIALGLLDRIAEQRVEARQRAWSRTAFLALPDPELAVSGRAGDAALVWDTCARVDEPVAHVKSPSRAVQNVVQSREPRSVATADGARAALEAPTP